MKTNVNLIVAIILFGGFFIIVSGLFLYNHGYRDGSINREKQLDLLGQFYIQSKDARIKQLEDALKLYKIDIPPEIHKFND